MHCLYVKNRPFVVTMILAFGCSRDLQDIVKGYNATGIFNHLPYFRQFERDMATKSKHNFV